MGLGNDWRVGGAFRVAAMLLVSTTTLTLASNGPQVHEETFEHNFKRIRPHQPPVFNYLKATQQDHRTSRYAQQQRSDLANIQRRGRMMLNTYYDSIVRPFNNKPVSMSFEESDWTPISGTNYDESRKNNSNLFEELSQNSYENDLDVDGSEKVEETQEIKRVDGKGNYIYVHPNILRQNFGLDSKETQSILKNTALNYKDKLHLSDLKELIGKNPNIQLEGLKNLLNQRQTSEESIKSHPTPFQNTVVSTVPTPNNIIHQPQATYNPIQSSTLNQLQKQLDEVAKAHAQNVLSKAQHNAAAYVEAQHKALALAQAQAKEKAIALATQQTHIPQNQHQYVNTNHLHVPIANQIQYQQLQNYANQHQSQVPLSHIMEVNGVPHQQLHQNVVPPQQYAAEHQHNVELQQNHIQQSSVAQNNVHPTPAESYVNVQHIPVQHNYLEQQQPKSSEENVHQVILPSFQYETAKQAISIEAQHDGSEDSGQEQELEEESDHVEEPKANVQPPKAYQEIILETNRENFRKIITKQRENNHDDLQYAAKYAFGYRILDHHKGNDFGHEEQRNGKSAKGHYYVLLPDGRRQKVEYYADNSGYHAKVTYDQQQARHPLESESEH